MVGRRRCFGSGRGGRSGGVGGSLVLPGLLSVSSDMVKLQLGLIQSNKPHR